MHLACADLAAHSRAILQDHRRVESTVIIDHRRIDEILERKDFPLPALVECTERLVAGRRICADEDDGEWRNTCHCTAPCFVQSLELAEATGFVQKFNPRSALNQRNCLLHLSNNSLRPAFALGTDLEHPLKKLRSQNSMTKFGKFIAEILQAEPVCDFDVDILRLLRECATLLLREEFYGLHVMEAIHELNHHDPHILLHKCEEFPDCFDLPCECWLLREICVLEFGERINHPLDVLPKLLLDFILREIRIIQRIMEKCHNDRIGIPSHIRKDVGYRNRMSEVRLSGLPQLSFVHFGTKLKCLMPLLLFFGAEVSNMGLERRPGER